MADTQIDYAALAKQAGATSSQPAPSAAVDYAVLAKQAGAIESKPAPNLVTGEGMESYAQGQAQQQAASSVHPVSRSSGILAPGVKTVEQDPDVIVGSAGSRSGMGLPGNLSGRPVQTEPESQATQEAKNALVMAGAAAAPELLGPEAGLLASSGMAGAGAGAGSVAGQALNAEDPTSKESLEETAGNVAAYGGGSLVLGGAAKGIGKGLEKFRAIAPDTSDWLFVRGSDGKLTQIHPEDLEAAQKVDPKLTVVGKDAPTIAKSTPKAVGPQKAGQQVQQELAATKEATGAKVGAAKTAVQESIPTTSTGESVAMTFTPESKSAVKANEILGNMKASKLGKDPGMSEVESLAKQFATGKDADGNVLTMSPEEIDASKRTLNDAIARMKNAKNQTAVGQLKQLKSAFEDDIYSFYEKAGDAKAAQDLRSFSGDYAKVNEELKKGPASNFFKTNKPEQIVSNIINSGPNAQSAVDSLAKNLSPEGLNSLQDSVTKEMYRRNTIASTGEVDMQRVQQSFHDLGDTAKSLYGKKYDDVKAFIDTASDLQKAKIEKADKGSMARRMAANAVKIATTAKGAGTFGIPGAIAGREIGERASDLIMNVGKSGAVQVGISPDEVITLSPKQASRARTLLSQLARAKKSGLPVAPIINSIQQMANANGPLNFEGPGIRYLLSDGRQVEVHPEDEEDLKREDPGATVIPNK